MRTDCELTRTEYKMITKAVKIPRLIGKVRFSFSQNSRKFLPKGEEQANGFVFFASNLHF